jgi:hypothetical protein
MTSKLKELLERAESWPAEVQEEAVEALLSIEQSTAYVLTPEDQQALAKSADDVRHERFVSPVRLTEFFERLRHA